MTEETLEQTAERLVRQEVLCCLSALVSTLANGVSHTTPTRSDNELTGLCEQAMELACCVYDYEEAAKHEGYEVAQMAGQLGWYAFVGENLDCDIPAGRTPDAVWRSICDEYQIEPYDREVYEHWSISDWLADKLIERGEKVDKDFAGLNVWARTCTGQGIAMDSVIQDIAKAVRAA